MYQQYNYSALPAAAIAGVVALMLPWTGTGHLLLARGRALAARGGFRGGGVVGSASGGAARLRQVQERSGYLQMLGTPEERGRGRGRGRRGFNQVCLGLLSMDMHVHVHCIYIEAQHKEVIFKDVQPVYLGYLM